VLRCHSAVLCCAVLCCAIIHALLLIFSLFVCLVGWLLFSIDTPEVIARVKMLFKGNNFLIQEFNAFLPPGYKILDSELEDVAPPTPPPPTGHLPSTPPLNSLSSPTAIAGQPQQQPQTDLDHARNYVRKIKVMCGYHYGCCCNTTTDRNYI
jgi:hypothetical protein